ncbi:MAG: ribbon-helix-helix domain-containing protein, partial [Pseudanabaenaceae cyanobacterium]
TGRKELAERLMEVNMEVNNGSICEGAAVGSELESGLASWSKSGENAEVTPGSAERPGKKKVTYYLSEDLQAQLKVRATIEQQAMSELVEEALRFYLEHGDLVKREGVGHTHRLYACPACQSMLMFRDGNLQSVPKSLASATLRQETMP